MYMYVYVHIYICIYIHTHIHVPSADMQGQRVQVQRLLQVPLPSKTLMRITPVLFACDMTPFMRAVTYSNAGHESCICHININAHNSNAIDM